MGKISTQRAGGRLITFILLPTFHAQKKSVTDLPSFLKQTEGQNNKKLIQTISVCSCKHQIPASI